MLNLTFVDQVPYCARNVFDGYIRVDAVLIEEIDHIGPEALERGLGDLADALGTAVESDILACVLVNFPSELSGDDDLIAQRSECLADELLVGEGAIDLGRIEEGDATLDGCAKQR